MENLKARIVFDLDGTLIDSVGDIHGAALRMLADVGANPITLSQSRQFVGNGAPKYIERVRAALDPGDDRQEQMLERFLTHYETAHGNTTIYPGVQPALRALTVHHLGICTNKPMRPCRAVLEHLDLATYFETVWAGDSLAVKKPDPAPLHAAFEALGEGPCIFVGDSEVDAETAERAGVPFVLFTEGYHRGDIDAMTQAARFSDYADLPGIIERIISD